MNLAGHHTKPVARCRAESLNQRVQGEGFMRQQKSKVENYESLPQIKIWVSKIGPLEVQPKKMC